MKKVVSLFIILASIASLVFMFFARDLISDLFIQTKGRNIIEYAHGVDRSGNIYYVRKEQEKSYLVSMDSTGRQSYKKDLSEIVPEQCVFDSIFIDQDKTLFLTAYGLTSDYSQISQVGIYMFRDDGSFVTQIFKNNIQQNYDSKFRLISAMSDDSTNVYFGFINDDSIDIFTYEKGADEPAKKTGGYSISQVSDKINASYVLPSGAAVLSLEGGTLLKKSSGADTSYQFDAEEKVIADRFWFAGNQFYFRDAVSGNIYISSALELDPSVVTKGSKVISDLDGVTFKQLDPVAVGNAGNVMGILNDGDTNRIFLGGFAFLPEIGKTDASGRNDLMAWFTLAGFIAGVIILSLLVWDFYCNILHMKLSILLRQALLVILVIFLALYTLTSRIIVPQTEDMIGSIHLTEQIQEGQMFIAAFKGSATGREDKELDLERAGSFFDQFGRNISNSQNSTNISLFIKDGGQYCAAASTDRYEEGFPAALLGYGKEFTDTLGKAEENEVHSFEIMTQRGKELCLLIPTGLTFDGSPVTLGMTAGLDVLDNSISGMTDGVTGYMRLIGLVLVLLVMIVEYFTVYQVRKLKKGVDKIAEGNYGREINVHSGDEIEDLSKSIQALSVSMLNSTNSLNKLNASYHRFVPQRFLELLGETHIENAGKQSQAHKDNVTMLFLRFRFLTSMGAESEEIFANINDVFESVLPVVSMSKGTVYDFLPDGFNAIYEGGAEDVLRSALRIREALGALNRQRKSRGLGEVDMRIFISKGNVLLGFIGEEKRMEPTAISAEAQKAEPMVHICFDSDIYIACTREILEELPQGVYRSRKIGEVMIQEEKVEVFDLYDSDPYAVLKTKEVHAQRFEMGVKLFMKGDYSNARNMFMDIIKYSSEDGTARNYMYIAEHNLRSEHKQITYTTIRELERMR